MNPVHIASLIDSVNTLDKCLCLRSLRGVCLLAPLDFQVSKVSKHPRNRPKNCSSLCGKICKSTAVYDGFSVSVC